MNQTTKTVLLTLTGVVALVLLVSGVMWLNTTEKQMQRSSSYSELLNVGLAGNGYFAFTNQMKVGNLTGNVTAECFVQGTPAHEAVKSALAK